MPILPARFEEKPHTRPQCLVSHIPFLLETVRPKKSARILVVGNTAGHFPVALQLAHPGPKLFNISTAFKDVVATRDLAERYGLEDTVGVTVDGLHAYREKRAGQFDLLIFHPHLQRDSEILSDMRSGIVRACTNIHDLLTPSGTAVVMALNPRHNLSQAFRDALRTGLIAGFDAVGMKIQVNKVEQLACPEGMIANNPSADNSILRSFLLTIAKK